MHQLILHPDCAPGPVTSLRATFEPTAGGGRAQFSVEGDIARVRVPQHAISDRTDFLWQTTCFEVFWQPLGGTFYREFNFAPSSRWASYDFDDVRQNGRNGPVDAIAIACSRSDHELVLEAAVTTPLLLPARVALNAVIEDIEGNIQYWALAFPAGRPDFHAEICRAVTLEEKP